MIVIELVMGGGLFGGSVEDMLTKTFGKVSHGAYDNIIEGQTVHTAALPNLYTWSPAHSRRETKLRDFFHLPREWTVDAIQGLGYTREESLESLCDEVMSAAMYGRLSVLEQKDGQNPLPVAIGARYKSVHQGEKLHDHDDPRMANFLSVNFDPFRGFVKGTMESSHSHLWAGEQAVLKPR